jgi:hypothetical protein
MVQTTATEGTVRDATVSEQLVSECRAMAEYALESGLVVPGPLLEAVQESYSAVASVRRLAQVHAQLVRIVAPATPRTLLLLARERETRGAWRFLGPVRLVRQMMLVGVVLLCCFIVTAISPDVNETSGDIFRSSGLALLVNEFFLISAAGVGAAFSALFRANRYVAQGTYDPKYESSYWVRFFLGLISGVVLAVLVPIDPQGQSFTRPLLALVGGFSASVVYRILSRLVDTLESLVQGEPREIATTRAQLAMVHAEQLQATERLRLGSTLVELRERIRAGGTPEELAATLSAILDDLVPPGPGGEPPAAEHPVSTDAEQQPAPDGARPAPTSAEADG